MITDQDNSPELPTGWVWTTLGKVCLDPQYGWTTSATVKGSLHLLRTTDISSGNIDWDSVPFCRREPPEKQKYLLKDGDIVISRAGSVGYSHLIKIPKEAVFASYLIRFRPLIDEVYLAYFLKSSSYWESISEKSLGIAIPNVNASKLKQVAVPVPPLAEQRRIVGKIEELFTKLDAGVEGLKKIKAQLKRYRQAVLKHAFEGKLTEEWREAQKAELEPAAALLERTKEEREKNAKGKYKRLPPVDTSDLPELPEGWVWVHLGVCASVITKGESPKWQGFSYVEDGVPFIRSENVLWGHADLGRVVRIPEEFHRKLVRSQVEADDVLVNLVGASIGRCGIVPPTVTRANINQAVALIRANNALDPPYLMHLLLSPGMQRRIHADKVETARPNISLGDLNSLAIPLAPLAEQRRIVSEIEKCLSTVGEAEKIVEKALKQAERLRQSILKKAFGGKLVPQDPSDEPADRLLERIRQERARLKENDTTAKSKNDKQLSLV